MKECASVLVRFKVIRNTFVSSGIASLLGMAGTTLAATPVDDAYSRTCAACHGAELRGGETGPALIGAAFQQKWASVPATVLEAYTRGSMPPTNPGGLSAAVYASAVARIRATNGWQAAAAANTA